jgi:uncharacterized protein YchJ
LKNPITGIAGCCARAASGQAVAAPPSRMMKSRRRIASPGLEDDFNQIRKLRPAKWGPAQVAVRQS